MKSDYRTEAVKIDLVPSKSLPGVIELTYLNVRQLADGSWVGETNNPIYVGERRWVQIPNKGKTHGRCPFLFTEDRPNCGNTTYYESRELVVPVGHVADADYW